MQVPGGYQDSLSSNTELGRAVQDACEELDNLSNLVCLASATVISKHRSWSSAACTHILRLVQCFKGGFVVLQEKESLTEASKLLQKLGYKGDIFERTAQPDASDE